MRRPWRRLSLRAQWTLAGVLLCSVCALGGFGLVLAYLESLDPRLVALLGHEPVRARGLAAGACFALWLLGVAGILGAGALLMPPLERVARAAQRLLEGEGLPVEGAVAGEVEGEVSCASDEAGRVAGALARLLGEVRTQVELLDALVGEACGFQERLFLEIRRGDTQARELLQTRDQLVVADRRSSVGTLSAGVAHEVNNPLAYITANIQFAFEEFQELARLDAASSAPLRDGEAWGELSTALAEARDGCARVQHIVQSLKSFSCGDDGRLAPMDLAPALKTALNMARNEIRSRARLVVEVPDQVHVHANEVRLAQVFLNLLLNAAQAITPGDAEHQEVRVSLRREADAWVRVSITDTGCGMTPDVRAHLFTPFFTTKPVGVGTGLGLSVCQGLVHGMGGRIDIQSEPGRGSTFTVWLPVAHACAEPEHTLSPPPRAPPRARVLVVDDEPLVGISLRRALGREHEVLLASSAREALARVCQAEPFDAILCDVMMPGMDGRAFHAELERTSPAQAARVLFISGGTFTPEAREFLERHAERLLLKPLDTELLRERLRALIPAPAPPPAAIGTRRSGSEPAAPRPSA